MSTDALTYAAQLYDRKILDMIVNGVTCEGDEGQRKTRPINAAEMNAINARLKMCGVTAVATPGSVLDDIRKGLESTGLKLTGDGELPELDLEDYGQASA